MPDSPTPLDLDAIREALGDRPALGRSAALGLIHEVERLRARVSDEPGECVMTHTPPFDFAQCETHDETFPLGAACKFHGRTSVAEVYADEADRMRARAVLAEEEVERLRAEVARLRERVLPDPRGGCSCTWHEQTSGPGYVEIIPEYDPACPTDSTHLYDPRSGQWIARPAPAWDEDAVTEAAARAIYDAFRAAEAEDTPDVGYSSWDETSSHMRHVARSQAAAAVALVRDHQHVKPSPEDIYRAWHGTDDPWAGCADSASIERVLDLLPGRSEAEVKAEELREFADAHRFPSHWICISIDGSGVTVGDALRARADRLAAEGGADRG